MHDKNNTTATHSPAPWKREIRFGPWIVDANGATVVTLANASLAEPVTDANANLIAAAPDLLAALKGMLDQPEDPINYDRMMMQAEAAIAKAEGK